MVENWPSILSDHYRVLISKLGERDNNSNTKLHLCSLEHIVLIDCKVKNICQISLRNGISIASAFHTIISHSDCKDVLAPPPSWDENGNIIYGGSDQMLTYFDISSAEVKASGYASKDPDLIDKFNKGEDIYIYSAKLYLGEEGWNDLSKKQQKRWRKRFKTIRRCGLVK